MSRPCMRLLLAILDGIRIATCHCAVISTMESACHGRGNMWTGEEATVCHLQNQKLVYGKPFWWAAMRMLTGDQAAVHIWLKWNLSHVITCHSFNHDSCYQENTADFSLWAASLQGEFKITHSTKSFEFLKTFLLFIFWRKHSISKFCHKLQ